MADTLGTINHIKIASELLHQVYIDETPTDIPLPSITVPNITNATIIAASLRMFVNSSFGGDEPLGLDGTQYIQIRKDTPGTWTNAIKFVDGAITLRGQGSFELVGKENILTEFTAFNDIYELQWDNALVDGGGTSYITLEDVYFELDIWFTLDSGVEAKVDAVASDVGVILADLEEGGRLDLLIDQIISDIAAAQGDITTIDGIVDDIWTYIFNLFTYTFPQVNNILANVNNNASTFRTYLVQATDDYWKDMEITIGSGVCVGQTRHISGYNGTTQFITVSRPFTQYPGDEAIILISSRVYGTDTISASGIVVADGGTTPSYFKTDLSSTTLNFWQNVQVLFLTGNNAGIARRMSAYSVAKFITLSEALPNIPVAADTFVIIGRVAGAGSSITEAGVADAVWDELKSGHTASTSFGKIVQDVETDVDAVLVDTAEIQGKLPTNKLMGSSDVDNHDTDIDAILLDTADMQPHIDAIAAKLPSSAYLKGTADADGGMDTADKADVNAQADLALSDYDPPTFTEMDAMETDLTAEIDANEAKIDILTTMVAQIQNNVFFSTTVLDMYQRPAAGSDTYRIRAMVFDGTGTPEDPDSEELYITLDGTSGSIIARTLMTKQSVGVYYYDVVIASTDTLEDWTFTFDYEESAVLKTHYRQSALTEWTSDLNDIQAKVTAVYVKVDAVAPSPTIPAQILQHDTDIKALPNVQSTPEYLVIPSGVTRINLEGGVDAVVTDIPIYDTTVLGGDGDIVLVLIGSEYIIGTIDTTNSQLTTCTRGAYSTVAATHADLVSIYEVMIHPLRLNIFDGELNMVAPDSAPTVSIVDWAGTVEIAPTSMTLISTGLYGYDYFCVAGTQAKSRTLRFSIIIGGITTLRQSTLMILDKPASLNNLIDLVGGGTGEFLVNQDGYLDGSGIFQYWTDTMKEYLRDATTGSRLDDVLVTAYRIVNGQVILALIPPGQTVCDVNGNYELRLDAGIYMFKFQKDQYRFPTDEVQRTVTA